MPLDGWTHNSPTGIIDQEELSVLLSWGELSLVAAVVPEPSSYQLLCVAIMVLLPTAVPLPTAKMR